MRVILNRFVKGLEKTMTKCSGGWAKKYAWLPFCHYDEWYWLEWYEVRRIAIFDKIFKDYRKAPWYNV